MQYLFPLFNLVKVFILLVLDERFVLYEVIFVFSLAGYIIVSSPTFLYTVNHWASNHQQDRQASKVQNKLFCV